VIAHDSVDVPKVEAMAVQKKIEDDKHLSE
jgi:hypothetical protein